MAKEPTKFMSTTGAAKLLSCSEATVRRLSDQGDLATIRVDTQKRIFPREAVEALAAKRAGGAGR